MEVKTVNRIKLKEYQGYEMTRPEMIFLLGGCEGSKKKYICCKPSGTPSGSCDPETTADSCDGWPCGDQISFNCA